MGRNKMEREFSEKLNQREIEPSAMAWDRLDAMLTVAEKEKPVRRLNWLYIAASFAGLLLVATMFFNSGNEVLIENQVVHQDDATSIETESTVRPSLNEGVSGMQYAAESTEKKSSHQSKSIKGVQSINQLQIAQNSLSQNPVVNQNPEIIRNQINQADIPGADELLAMAQTNAAVGPVKTVKVNASKLLSQVDGEPDMTFRQKVIQKVGRNYQSVKVALANRNIEEENH